MWREQRAERSPFREAFTPSSMGCFSSYLSTWVHHCQFTGMDSALAWADPPAFSLPLLASVYHEMCRQLFQSHIVQTMTDWRHRGCSGAGHYLPPAYSTAIAVWCRHFNAFRAHNSPECWQAGCRTLTPWRQQYSYLRKIWSQEINVPSDPSGCQLSFSTLLIWWKEQPSVCVIYTMNRM